MNHQNPFLAALTKRTPCFPVPFWEIEFHLAGAWVGKPLILGSQFLSLPAFDQQRALEQNAEIITQACREIGFHALTIPGGLWEEAPGKMAFYTLPPKARIEQARLIRAMLPSSVVLVAVGGPVISANYDPDFCSELYENPQKVTEDARKRLKDGLNEFAVLRDVGCQAFVTASDIADNHGVFFNPQQMKEIILPLMEDFCAEIHSWKCPALMHCDGLLDDATVDALVNTGINGLQALDPIAGMDLIATQRRLGSRLTLCGNLDCALLLGGTPEKIAQETRDLITKAGPHGGFVLGLTNAVQPDVPVANYRAMVETWKSLSEPND